MKYCVQGFYQPRAVELGLTNDDLLVLRWFVDFTGTKKMKTIVIEEKVFYWVNYKTVLADLPVLKMSVQTLRKSRFGNLHKATVLIRTHLKDGGGTHSYYCYGLNYETLQYLQNDTAPALPRGKKIPLAAENYQPRGSEIPHKDNNTIINKKVSKKEVKSFDEIINNYTADAELRTTIFEYIKMLQLKKKPPTNHALHLMLNKLDKLTFDIREKNKILEQSIVNGWADVYELKIKPGGQHEPPLKYANFEE